RYLTDHVIAAAAAEEVVDLPEGVDVQQYQRSGIVSGQVLQQPLPVGQPGQRVGVQAAELAQGIGHQIQDHTGQQQHDADGTEHDAQVALAHRRQHRVDLGLGDADPEYHARLGRGVEQCVVDTVNLEVPMLHGRGGIATD